MRGGWGLIVRGFAIACLGASASMLYIVGLSAGYVGRFSLAAIALILGALGAFGFYRLIGSYLDALDQRERSEISVMSSRVAADAGVDSVAVKHPK
jgi:hypothetical protein